MIKEAKKPENRRRSSGRKRSGRRRNVVRSYRCKDCRRRCHCGGSRCIRLCVLPPECFPGVTVGPIAVGGMNRDDAANTIEDQSAPLYEGKNVTVTIYGSNYDIPVDKVLKSVDGIQSAENAYERGRTGTRSSACAISTAQCAATERHRLRQL